MSKNTEIRIATVGQVDSGKSTILGILTNPKNKKDFVFLDNGRGKARKTIFKHKHETETGRTSCITHCYSRSNNKILSFIDLAGHEKYLSTTMKGISSTLPDYIMTTISCNKVKIPKITKEHLGIALAYKIPIIIVITKIDMPNIELKLKQIEKKIILLMKSKAAGYKKVLPITNLEESEKCSFLMNHNDIKSYCPLFKVSNTTGKNLNLLKNFLHNLSPNRNNSINETEKLFIIDNIHHVPGVGIVVSGIQKKGEIKKGDQLFIGPINKEYLKIMIKSIHNNYREFIDILPKFNSGSFWIKSIEKKKILNKSLLNGDIVITTKPKKYICFDAIVSILQHPTSIKIGYEPVIHTGNISQSAKITKIYSKKNGLVNILRAGDSAKISFKFLYNPVFLEVYNSVIFREGKTKGVGKIISVY